MSFTSTVRVLSGNGSRYLQQICKHWSQSAEGQREALKDVVPHYLDRFALREALLRFNWQDDTPSLFPISL